MQRAFNAIKSVLYNGPLLLLFVVITLTRQCTISKYELCMHGYFKENYILKMFYNQ